MVPAVSRTWSPSATTVCESVSVYLFVCVCIYIYMNDSLSLSYYLLRLIFYYFSLSRPHLFIIFAEYDYTGGKEHDPSHPRSSTDSSFVPDWWNNGATASQGECAVPVYYRFNAPPNGNSIFWYSFVYGNIFVIQISSEHNFTAGSEQWVWLKNTLASVNRQVTPWLLVTLHRPIYSTQECETGDYVVSLHLRRELDPLFEAYKVDVVLVAHTHAYERTCPLLGGICVPDGQGVVHLTVGSAGAGLESCGYSPKYGNFSRAHINTFGYLRAETSDQHIRLQFILDLDGSVYDEYYVQRRKM